MNLSNNHNLHLYSLVDNNNIYRGLILQGTAQIFILTKFVWKNLSVQITD